MAAETKAVAGPNEDPKGIAQGAAGWLQSVKEYIEDLKAELAKRDKDDVPGIFWTAFGWGSYIQLSLTEPSALADLPRTEAMMDFVARVDSGFYYGGAHLFLGTL